MSSVPQLIPKSSRSTQMSTKESEPNEIPSLTESVLQCLDQMKRLSEQYEDIKEKVVSISDRLSHLELINNQMYRSYLMSGSDIPFLGFPGDDDSSTDESWDALGTLFEGLYFPGKECELQKSQTACIRKLNRERIRISEQVSYEKDNDKFNLAISGLVEDEKIEKYTFGRGKNRPSFACLQGFHQELEDNYTCFSIETEISPDPSIKPKKADVFAIFDGHGGSRASIFCRNSMEENLKFCMNELNKDGEEKSIVNALTIAFVRLDSMFREFIKKHPELNTNPGTTACLAMFVDGNLYIANCGDSRVVLNIGDPSRPLQLSYDFKASDSRARETTSKRSGIIKDVDGIELVEGVLPITRAIGSESLRLPRGKVISARPKVVKIELSKGLPNLALGSLILGTKGLFKTASNKQVINTAYELQAQGVSPIDIASTLVSAARQAGSEDDVTVGVIPLKDYCR